MKPPPLLMPDVTPERRAQSLRGYQQQAVQSVLNEWQAVPSTLGTAATGMGKTTIIAGLLAEHIDPSQQRVLVIAHTMEIVDQIHARIANQFGGKLDQTYITGDAVGWGIGRVTGEHKDHHARVVCATRQSCHKKALDKMHEAGAFDVLVIDEAHHAFADNTYGKLIERLRAVNPALKIVGVTATPKRGDRKALGSLFESIAFEYPLSYGIANGYLVPMLRYKVQTKVDASAVRTRRGDYSPGQLVSILQAENWIDLAADAYHQYITPTGRLTMAFFPTVAMSQQFAERLQADGVPAAHLDGNTPKSERRRILRDYRRGVLRAVTNVAVLTEGFDAPETQAIFLARPTRSESLYTQIAGRGVRPHPGKKDCLLVDLSVTDARALNTGTLLGDMTRCPQCGIEHYKGLTVCPKCGFFEARQPVLIEVEEDKADGDAPPAVIGDVLGDGLIATLETLSNAWHTGRDGLMTCSLVGDGAMVIVPPGDDGSYQLYEVAKSWQVAPTLHRVNEDLASLMVEADALISDRGKSNTSKEAFWRTREPSQKQIDFAVNLGIKITPGMSRGDVSAAIEHQQVLRKLEKHQIVRVS